MIYNIFRLIKLISDSSCSVDGDIVFLEYNTLIRTKMLHVSPLCVVQVW